MSNSHYNPLLSGYSKTHSFNVDYKIINPNAGKTAPDKIIDLAFPQLYSTNLIRLLHVCVASPHENFHQRLIRNILKNEDQNKEERGTTRTNIFLDKMAEKLVNRVMHRPPEFKASLFSKTKVGNSAPTEIQVKQFNHNPVPHSFEAFFNEQRGCFKADERHQSLFIMILASDATFEKCLRLSLLMNIDAVNYIRLLAKKLETLLPKAKYYSDCVCLFNNNEFYEGKLLPSDINIPAEVNVQTLKKD